MRPPLSAISIHAPLAGCDREPHRHRAGGLDFNPRTPCGVRRHAVKFGEFFQQFQSTHPLRGATNLRYCVYDFHKISIHAPLAGCDASRDRSRVDTGDFNPRTPCGVRRNFGSYTADHRDFNPRTPCGVRLKFCPVISFFGSFQSTHPLRGATDIDKRFVLVVFISIHAPLAGCDSICCMAYKASPPSKGGPIKK